MPELQFCQFVERPSSSPDSESESTLRFFWHNISIFLEVFATKKVFFSYDFQAKNFFCSTVRSLVDSFERTIMIFFILMMETLPFSGSMPSFAV